MDAVVGTFRRGRSVFAALGALVLVMGALGGVVLITSSGADTTSKVPATSPAAPATGFVLTCISPDEVDDGVDTSSRTDTWVPEGTAVPAGCTRG